MVKFRKSLYLVLLTLFYIVETGLKPVSTQTITDTDTNKNSITPNKSRIAFLVGINSYKATTSLKYAVGDSEAIEDLLLRTGKYDKLIKLNDYGKITTTLNPETQVYSSQRIKMAPTKANIEATYQEVLASNPDTLLFYYSGHGFIEGEGGENFIAPKDVDVKFEKRKVGKEEKQVPVPLNGISLKVMGVQAAKVKRVVFLIDACRSPLPEADGEESKKGEKALSSTSNKDELVNEKNLTSKEIQLRQNLLSTRTDKLPKRVLEAEGITMLIGAAPEVSSLEDEDFKSGIFTHFLKKAFNGGVQEENQEEYITEENLSRYIEDRFKHYYELRKKESELAAEPKLYNLTFDRGKKGEILISQHRPIEGKERIDKPIYTDTVRKREVKGKLVYNEKGEREDLRFFVHDKKRDMYYPDSLDGVYKMEYSFKKDKTGELENFSATEYNLENEEVFEYGTRLIPDVGWEYRGIYNASDTATDRSGNDSKDSDHKDDHRKDLINQVLTMALTSADKEKIRLEKKIYDFNGNVISEEYFDANGKPLEFGGVSKIVRAYDKDGQVILEEFHGKDILDEYGDVIEKGKLIAKDGFARYKAKYKSKGNLLIETWEDVNGKILNNKLGYAKTKYIYDKNDRLTKRKFYDSENKPTNDKSGVSVYSYSYNADCIRLYESVISEITKKENKQALKSWKLGKYKLCLAEEIHTDKEGNPANDENQIYRKIRSFNKKGYLVSEESFQEDGRRHLENGVAKVEYTHDSEGNITSRKNFGEFEVNGKPVPVSDGNGVHEYRYTYQEYFSYDGKPILNECIYHRKDKGILLEPYGCALKIEHFGINDKPIDDTRSVFRTNIYYIGAYQEEADRHYYSLNNRSLWVERGWPARNPYGNQTLTPTYKTNGDKKVLVSKIEYKCDERNNKTLEATYETKEGKEILVTKFEYKYDVRNNRILDASYNLKEGRQYIGEYRYDERNNKTLEAFIEIKQGKEIFIRKHEWKYDEKNNLILEADYGAKEGKELLLWKRVYKFNEKNMIYLKEFYQTKEGIEVLTGKTEYKYDDRNNTTLEESYEIKDKIDILIYKHEYNYDERNNLILDATYEIKEGKEILVNKFEYEYDEKNNKTLYEHFISEESKEVLVTKVEYKHKLEGKNRVILSLKYERIGGALIFVDQLEEKYDERNNRLFYAKHEIKEGKLVLEFKNETEYDERNNRILNITYEPRFHIKKEVWKFNERNKQILEATYIGVNEIPSRKTEWIYDERDNMTMYASYEKQDGKEILNNKYEYKFDERNNKTLEVYYSSKEGKEVFVWKKEYKYDERNNKTFFAKYMGEEETIEEKNTLDYRLESYAATVTQYQPQIKEIQALLEKTKDESEKKSLNQKLEDLKKEFEGKKKKYTLSEEKFGENEKLISATYKLLFFNPRGPAVKRLMRVDLDLFYRPVKLGFEEE